jgi:hypothetical protein
MFFGTDVKEAALEVRPSSEVTLINNGSAAISHQEEGARRGEKWRNT